MRILAASILVLTATDAWAGDKGACRKARREQTLDGWTKYVLDHPDGVCQDEAMGQMMVLAIGRVVNGIAGDPTKVALAMAQLGHMSNEDFAQFRELMGGLGALGGLGGGGLGALGGGLGGLGEGFGGLGEGGFGSDGDMSGLLGTLGSGSGGEWGGIGSSLGGGEDQIYVGFSVVSTAGGWDSDAFYTVLDDARFGLQDCWKEKNLALTSVTYDAEFALASGKPSVKGLKMTYSSDSQPHPEAEACVKQELGKLSFPAEFSGTYTYRVDFY